MFGKFDLNKEIKIPKGVVMMLKSFGLDAKELEQQLFGMGKNAIALLEHCDARLTALANQHQLLHEQKNLLLTELHTMHGKLDKLLQERETGNGRCPCGIESGCTR